MRTIRLSLLLVLPAAVALAACSGTAASTPTATVTAPAPTSSAATADPGAGGSPSDTPTPIGPEKAGCRAADLKGSVQEANGGAAAGSQYVDIVLTNTSGGSCFLQGWPGVSLVTGGDGQQLGAAADQDRSSDHPAVTLAAGASAKALVTIAEAGNYAKAECDPQDADGFRVYPPGSKDALFIEQSGITGCAKDDVKLLTVEALVAG